MPQVERRESPCRCQGAIQLEMLASAVGCLHPVADGGAAVEIVVRRRRHIEVRIIEQCRLVDVLGEWGIHEGEGRLQLPAGTFDGGDRLLNGVEVALTRRSPLAWRVLAGWPIAALRIEIAPADVPVLRIADGRTVDDWTTAVLKDQSDSGAHVRRLADAAAPVTGPLVCTAQSADGSVARVNPPIVIFDGWHRAAGWVAQLRRGQTYSITGQLIVTERPVPLLGA